MFCKVLNPADTDVFKMSSGRLEKIKTSNDQTSLEVLKTTNLRFEYIQLTTSWRRLIYVALNAFYLH